MRRVNNKIVPYKLNLIDPIKGVTGLGSHSCSSIRGKDKKATYVCPDRDCHYTSRIWNSASPKNYKNSVSSFNCPHHNLQLIFLGDATEIPSKGNRRKKFMNLLLNK